MSRYRKITTICCAAVFALGVAACGGGGDSLTADQQAALAKAEADAETVKMLREQIAALEEKLGAEPGEASDEIDTLQARLEELEAAEMEAEEEEQRKANAAKMATAMKLYDGISAPMGAPASPAATDRAAAYNAADAPTSGTAAATLIMVSIGDGTNTPTAVPLSEDKKTTVAANHGWAGKRYARTTPSSEGMYEAVVYSNVGEPTQGEKFSTQYTANLSDGVLAATIVEDVANSGRVASPRFDQSSGIKRFPLPDPNPSNATTVTIPGSFHGVAGIYSCTPGGNAVCATRVAAQGFELGTVPSATDATWAAASSQWTFKPTNPETRLMSTPDAIYASYGWWIHKSADDKTYTASAFVDDKGAVPAAAGITALQGTATYMGGAAGKYALSSSTGGTNDAGHFTANAMLEADFGDDMITGTIDNFMGADGMSRNWSVELMEQTITDGGLINGTDGAGAGGASMTKWTVDGTAGDAGGQWSGALKDNGDDGVPKVATGTFHSTFGQGNSMVGAFGVNKQ